LFISSTKWSILGLILSKEKPVRLTRKKRLVIYAVITIVGVSVAYYNAINSFNFVHSKDWNFDSYQNNTIPEDFVAMETDQSGTWLIKAYDSAPSPPNVLEKLPGNDSSTYHIQIMPDSPTITEATVSMKFKIMPGHKTEAAGLILRFIDKSHFFVLIADPMNNRLSLCKSDTEFVICNYEATTQISVGEWHTMKVNISAQGIGAYLDDVSLIKANNSYYSSGQIGLWTKGDTEAYFDDLKVNY